MFWWAVAWGGERELQVERALALSELERFADALAIAEALVLAHPEDAEILSLYGRITGAVGWQNLAATPSRQPSELDRARAELLALVESNDLAGVKAAIKSGREAHADEPVYFGPLWTTSDHKIEVQREKLLESLTDADRLEAASVEELYRLRRLVVETDDLAAWERVNAALVAGGEAEPAPRGTLDRLGRENLALSMSKQPVVPLVPWMYPSEALEVGDKLGKLWTLAGRHSDLAGAWEGLQVWTDDSRPSARASVAALEAHELTRADDNLRKAYAAAGAPRQADLSVSNDERLRAELSDVLVSRARVRLAAGDVVGARGDLGSAFSVARLVVDSALAERIDESSGILEGGLAWKAPRGGTPADAALAAALADPTANGALVALNEARFLTFSGMGNGRPIAEQPDLWSEAAALTFEVEARVFEAQGQAAEARTSAVIATVLGGRHQAGRWAHRAALHQALGEEEAAFVAASVARALGATGLDPLLRETFRGPGTWEDAASRVAPEVRPEQAVAPHPTSNRGGGGGGGGGGTVRATAGPKLGSPFPSVKVTTDAGTLNVAGMRGRLVVVVMLDDRCAPCTRMMPPIAQLVRNLRADGTDVAVVLFSLDDTESGFRHLETIGRSWGQVVWAPDLRSQWGVSRLPTTWVVDREGVTRYFVDHELTPAELQGFVDAID